MSVVTGQENGTSEALTVQSATSVLEGLLSAEEEQESPETQPDAESIDEVEDAPESTEDGEEVDAASDESDEEEDAEEKPATPRKFKVKVADEELEVDEPELIKGYSRTADYTRKTQALAEERKAQQAEFDAVRAERQRYATQLVQLEEALGNAAPAEPDWDRLAAENPEQFVETRQAWDKFNKQRAEVAKERDAAIAKVQADQAVAHKDMLESERSKLIAAIPEWIDSAVAKKEMAELSTFAKSTLGFTEDQVKQVFDHRLVLLLRMANAHQKAEKAKPEVQKKIDRVKVATPGAKVTKPKATATAKAMQRLGRTHSVQDAAAVLLQSLDD